MKATTYPAKDDMSSLNNAGMRQKTLPSLRVATKIGLPPKERTMFKAEIRILIWGIFLVALGGLLLHLRIHPPRDEASNWLPIIFGVLSVVALPILLPCRKTVAIGYLLNAAAVVAGIISMAWFSVEHWEGPKTWDAILLKSTLADILILMSRLPIAHAILKLHRHKTPA